MEARTLRCQSCGASVGEAELQCPYCKSQLATVACPQCFGMVPRHAHHCPQCGAVIQPQESLPSALTCPGCRTPLATSTLSGLTLDQCPACGGLWVAQQVFEKIAADREQRGLVLTSLPGPASSPVTLAPVRYRPCPHCARLMNRLNYARISGVVLDVCKDHGLWFDQDELRQVLAFIEAGGLEKSRTRELENLDEHRRLTAVALPAQSGGEWTEVPTGPLTGGAGLVRAVESLLSLFIH